MERRVPLSSHTTGEVPTGQQLVRQPTRGRQAVRERSHRNLTTLRRTATLWSTQSGSSGAAIGQPGFPVWHAGRVKSRIMYIESKADGMTGDARIGRVTFS